MQSFASYMPATLAAAFMTSGAAWKVPINLFSETTESLNCLRWGYVREYIGIIIRVAKGDTRSLDLKP